MEGQCSLPGLKGVTSGAHSMVADPQNNVIAKIHRDTLSVPDSCAGFTRKWRSSSIETWWCSLVQTSTATAFATQF